MVEAKPSRFKLNKGRVLILALGALILVFAISMWMGGINSYQSLREANTAATQPSAEQVDAVQTPAQ
jgi:hypothetical protein